MTIKQKQLGGITELDKDGYGVINVNGARIRNVGAPIDGYDVAVKAYVQQVVSESGGGGGVTDHGALTGLGDDDHLQYIHNTTARIITAQHTLNPSGAPFVVGINATNQLVSGLNADKVDGYDASVFLHASGSVSMSGNLNANTNKVINLGEPTVSTDAATKSYVDGYTGWKDVNIASDANIATSKLSSGTEGYILKTVSGEPTWAPNTGVVGDIDLREYSDGSVSNPTDGWRYYTSTTQSGPVAKNSNGEIRRLALNRPYADIRDYGARSITNTGTSLNVLASGTSGNYNITVTAGNYLKNGDYVVVHGAGATNPFPTPPPPQIEVVGTGTIKRRYSQVLVSKTWANSDPSPYIEVSNTPDISAPAIDQDNAYPEKFIRVIPFWNTITHNFPSLSPGNSAFVDLTITGARVGDGAVINEYTGSGLNIVGNLKGYGADITAVVIADDTVRITATNNKTTSINLPNITYGVQVIPANVAAFLIYHQQSYDGGVTWGAWNENNGFIVGNWSCIGSVLGDRINLGDQIDSEGTVTASTDTVRCQLSHRRTRRLGYKTFNDVDGYFSDDALIDNFGNPSPILMNGRIQPNLPTASNSMLKTRIVSGGGTTSITLQDPLQNSITNKLIMIDNSTPIANAIANNTHIYIPNGVFWCWGDVSIDPVTANSKHILGEGGKNTTSNAGKSILKIYPPFGMYIGKLATYSSVQGIRLISALRFFSSNGTVTPAMTESPVDVDWYFPGAGLFIRSECTIRDVHCSGFYGTGILVRGASSENTNANRTQILHCTSGGNMGHGIATSGGDGNIVTVMGGDCVGNFGVGFFDASFLGGTWIGCHASLNEREAYRVKDNTCWAAFIGCYSEIGHLAAEIHSPAIWLGGDNGSNIKLDANIMGNYFVANNWSPHTVSSGPKYMGKRNVEIGSNVFNVETASDASNLLTHKFISEPSMIVQPNLTQQYAVSSSSRIARIGWDKFSVSITTEPLDSNQYIFTEDSSNSEHKIQSQITTGVPGQDITGGDFADLVPNGITVELSAFIKIKPGGRQYAVLYGNGGDSKVWFDISGGYIGTQTNIVSGKCFIKPCNNDGYKCTITYVKTSGKLGFCSADTDGLLVYTGDGRDNFTIHTVEIHPYLQNNVNTLSHKEVWANASQEILYQMTNAKDGEAMSWFGQNMRAPGKMHFKDYFCVGESTAVYRNFGFHYGSGGPPTRDGWYDIGDIWWDTSGKVWFYTPTKEFIIPTTAGWQPNYLYTVGDCIVEDNKGWVCSKVLHKSALSNEGRSGILANKPQFSQAAALAGTHPGFNTAIPDNEIEWSYVTTGITTGWQAFGRKATTTASLNFGVIDGYGGWEDLTVTISGAAIGDTVIATPQSAYEGGLVWNAWVSATNVVTVRMTNIKGTSSSNPAAITWSIDCYKH